MPRTKALLTFDEKKAAEAAFRGLPLDPVWPRSAQAIYYGILAQTGGRNIVEEATQEAIVLIGGESKTATEFYASLV